MHLCLLSGCWAQEASGLSADMRSLLQHQACHRSERWCFMGSHGAALMRRCIDCKLMG